MLSNYALLEVNMEERDEIVISLTDIIEILKRNFIFIVATVLVFSLSSFFITKFFIPIFMQFPKKFYFQVLFIP